jgi:hypothetical protein
VLTKRIIQRTTLAVLGAWAKPALRIQKLTTTQAAILTLDPMMMMEVPPLLQTWVYQVPV